MSSPITGDAAYLGSLIAGLTFWGLIGDGQSPPMINGSFELSGTDGSIDLTPIQGPQGPPGTPADIVKMQFEDNFTSPADLPENLTNADIDIGKAWWIGNVVFVWSGTNWWQKSMGVPGPVGPAPEIVCQAELVPSGLPTSLIQPIEVKQFGEPVAPSLLFQFDQDSITGPPGTSGPIVDAPDFDNTTGPPSDGDAIVWNSFEQMWQPSSFDFLSFPVYSISESEFQAYNGKALQQNVCTFSVPPQPFAWIPLVFGNVTVTTGPADIFQPNVVRTDLVVLLGDPIIGQQVAIGFGNLSNYNLVQPHFSTATNPAAFISPTTSTAVVPAYHVGNQGTLYFELVPVGHLKVYRFSPNNSQALIMCVPVSQFMSPPTGQHQLGGRGSLTASAVWVP